MLHTRTADGTGNREGVDHSVQPRDPRPWGRPADRHRAYADVDATALVFMRLIDAADREGALEDLAGLVKIAGRTAKTNRPVQQDLFDL